MSKKEPWCGFLLSPGLVKIVMNAKSTFNQGIECSVFSATAGLKSGQFDRKRKFDLVNFPKK